MDVTQHIRGSQPVSYEASKVSKDTKINISELMKKSNITIKQGQKATFKTASPEYPRNELEWESSVGKKVFRRVNYKDEGLIVYSNDRDEIWQDTPEEFDARGFKHVWGDERLEDRNAQTAADLGDDLLSMKTEVTSGGVVRAIENGLFHKIKILLLLTLIINVLQIASWVMKFIYFVGLDMVLGILFLASLLYLGVKFGESLDYSNLLRA